MAFSIGFIGTGNMAGAMLHSLRAVQDCPFETIYVFDTFKEKMAPFIDSGCAACANAAELAQKADIIVPSVKPQVIADVLKEIAPYTAGKTILSIAAGISTQYIRSVVGGETFLVRAMPNTPLMIGCGTVALARADDVPEEIFSACRDVFAGSGDVHIIDEALMNEVIAVSSSTPAYFYKLVDAIASAAADMGISYSLAVAMAAHTMEGAAKMMLSTGKTPQELIDQVSSKGGTTVAALNSMKDDGFDEMIARASKRCVERARELSL